MNGVAALQALLSANGPLGQLVAPERIAAGVLPQGTALPAISIMSISSIDRNIPDPGGLRRVTDRVQVTVMASTYQMVKMTVYAVRGAAADQMPIVAGIAQVVIHTEGAGPDFMDEEACICMQAQDFRVSFNEAR